MKIFFYLASLRRLANRVGQPVSLHNLPKRLDYSRFGLSWPQNLPYCQKFVKKSQNKAKFCLALCNFFLAARAARHSQKKPKYGQIRFGRTDFFLRPKSFKKSQIPGIWPCIRPIWQTCKKCKQKM